MPTILNIVPGRFSNDEAVEVAQVFPTATNSPGKAGQVAFDTTHLYICIAENTWRRATIGTWP